MRYCIGLLLLAVTATGCEKATEPPAATTITANSSLTVAAAVGAPVSPSPSVVVKDQHGSGMGGISVTFTVTSGGGTVTGASATTGADGIATVGSWILGTTAGQNVLTVSSGTLTPVTFTATGSAGPPSAVTKSAGDNGSGVVGTVLASRPSILVKDAYGNPAPGVNVTFAIGTGGGTLTGAAQTTGSDGIATVGSWTLGTVATTHTVIATAGSLPPVTFFATALAGPSARVIAISGNSQTGRAGTRAQQIVAARVTDSFNNGKSGVTVVFAVTQGGGSIIGPSTMTTDFQGIAQIQGWTLGPAAGVNLITATVAGVGTATFATTTTANVCVEGSHTVGGSNSGVLDASDCVIADGSPVDFYRVQVAGQSSVEFHETSSNFDTYMYLTDGAGFSFAENDDDASSTNSQMTVIMPPGTYHLGASSFGGLGSYTVSSSAVSESEERCSLVFLIAGIGTSQSVASTDCVNRNNTALHADVFAIELRAGSSVTFRMSSSAVDPYLEFYSLAGALVASNDNVNSTTTAAEVRYTPASDGYYYIVARTAVGNQVGAYDLAVTLNSSSASARATQLQVGSARTLYPRKGQLSLPWSSQR